MPIDSSIAMGYRPMQLENPVNQLGQIMQLQGAQQANQLNSMRMDEYTQNAARKNKLLQLMGAMPADATDEQRSATLKGGGYFTEADQLDKSVLERMKTKSEVGAKDIETAHKKIDMAGSAFNYVRQNPTLENAIAVLDHLGRNGVYSPADVAKYKEQVTANPASIQQLADVAFRGALSAKEQLPAFDNFSAGDRHVTQQRDPVTGVIKEVGSTTINQSPDNKATVGASMANAAATREVAKLNAEAARIQTGFNNEQGLRKEFEGLPEVKNYKQAYPAYAAIKDAAGRNTTQSDINIVYGLAKLYDPTSVVREGEYATVANSPNIPEKVKGYAQYLAGGGRLSEGTKKQILAEAQGRIGTYEAEAKKAKTSYEGIAKKRGMEPSSVFAGMGDMVETKTPGVPDMSAIDAEIARRKAK